MCSREYPETSTERGAPLGGGPRGPGQAGSAGPLSLRPSGGFRLCRRKPEHSRCRCPAGARVPPGPVDAAAPLSTRTEEGDGEEPVHMPGSLVEAAAGACAPSPRRLGRRGARAPLRARTLARAGRRLPRLRSGSEPLRRVRAWSRADPSGRVLWAPGPRRPLPASSQPVPPFPHGMGPALLGVARPGPGSRSVSRCQPLPGSRRLALSLSQWRRRLR